MTDFFVCLLKPPYKSECIFSLMILYWPIQYPFPIVSQYTCVCPRHNQYHQNNNKHTLTRECFDVCVQVEMERMTRTIWDIACETNGTTTKSYKWRSFIELAYTICYFSISIHISLSFFHLLVYIISNQLNAFRIKREREKNEWDDRRTRKPPIHFCLFRFFLLSLCVYMWRTHIKHSCT